MKPNIDPNLIMDDIIEKLMLLDYDLKFCKAQKRKAISRIFFSHSEDEGTNKCEYLYELSYWLMSLSNSRRLGAYLPFNTFKQSPEAISKLVGDAKKLGVKFHEFFDPAQLVQGHGESVCYLVDDLLNRELIRRDYKFLAPKFPNDSDSDSDVEHPEGDDERLINPNNSLSTNATDQRKIMIAKFSSDDMGGGVTTTNFFSTSFVDESQMDLSQMEDREMIMGCIDPDEWQREVQ